MLQIETSANIQRIKTKANGTDWIVKFYRERLARPWQTEEE